MKHDNLWQFMTDREYVLWVVFVFSMSFWCLAALLLRFE